MIKIKVRKVGLRMSFQFEQMSLRHPCLKKPQTDLLYKTDEFDLLMK